MVQSEESALVTVAAVRERREDGAVQCLFNERQQVFELPSSERTRERIERQLGEAADRGLPVRVVLNPRRGTVQRVATATAKELREFERGRVLLEDPEKPARIDTAVIDPTTFNVVDYYLKWPILSRCRRIVPSYKVAKEIFDFCAEQSCHLPGPPTISHCIPFQYVIDGCYARAHKMRQIIVDQYGYCCEKVFSFANQDWDTLAVKANKWGGCCVTWWYHVAPLVRVRVRIRLASVSFEFVLAMVIDPGMFNKPVLLSTWLTAQANAVCSPYAKVSMYSIQAGSAYWPANYQGTAFGTDPNYTNTHAALSNYANLTTCP
jgi:hypothetical protein